MCRSLLILVALLVTGCTSAETEARAKAEADAKDDAKCQSAGFQPGTLNYDQCRAKLADLRTETERSALSGRLQNRPPQWANF